ncbi:phage holin family protein [Breznakia sp. OttesenSCG-928-G09]|nr:phage holin family protein [Breznakia sp. OttesenSCG-928-G09]
MNLKVRIKNSIFWIQVLGSGILAALTYNQMQPSDLTTWKGLIDLLIGVVTNPFLLFTVLWNIWTAANDPTTSGITDSVNALNYDKPNADKGK